MTLWEALRPRLAASREGGIRCGTRRVHHTELVARVEMLASEIRACGCCTIREATPLDALVRALACSAARVPFAIADPFWSPAQREAVEARLRANGPTLADDRENADPLLFIGFTSGTSGIPKGYLRRTASWLRSLERSVDVFGLRPEDRICVMSPLAHSLGLYAAIEALFAGASLALLERYAPDAVLAAIDEDGVDALVGVPTMYYDLVLAAGARARTTVSRLVCAGAALPRRTRAALAETFPHARLFTYYGASELGFVAVDGRPFPGVEVVVLDPDGEPLPHGELGQLWVLSDLVFDGYLDPVDGAGCVRRGALHGVRDLGRIDDAGFVSVVGRDGEMFVSGGLNVYPAEIEARLREHPAIDDAVVFGVPDERRGDVPIAVVTLRRGQTASASSLRDHVRATLQPFKAPVRFLLAGDVPVTPNGKVARGQLREAVARDALRELR
jgi:acyl-CoA synthetase (AMP-forming)/AMP-acid ligase II